MRRPLAAALAAYVAAIVAANAMTAHWGLVGVGFGLVVTAGTFAAGFALVARDYVHRLGGVPVVLAAIGAGAGLSWWLASPQLALASGVAFGAAELADLAVFAPAWPRIGFLPAIALSNLIAAPVDTVLFLHIAGFGVTWQAVTGQLVAKLLWATALPLLALYLAHDALSRHTVHAGG